MMTVTVGLFALTAPNSIDYNALLCFPLLICIQNSAENLFSLPICVIMRYVAGDVCRPNISDIDLAQSLCNTKVKRYIKEDSMKKTAKVYTVINYILSAILWLLGILTLLFNLLGLWTAWHLVGFLFIFYIPIPAMLQILAIVFSCSEKGKKRLLWNLVSSIISIISVLLTVFVSSTWFW